MFTDPLERRMLLASVIADGKLTVSGTDGSDAIDVFLRNGAVVARINGVEQTFSGVTTLRVDANGGHDRVAMAQDITRNATITGSAGNDTITAGGGNDLILGGRSSDIVNGGRGFNSFSYADYTSPVNTWLDVFPPKLGTTAIQFIGGGTTTSGEIDSFSSVQQLIGGSGGDELSTRVREDTSGETTYPWGPGMTSVRVGLILRGGPGADDMQMSGLWDSATTAPVSFAPTLFGGDGEDTFGFNGGTQGEIYGENEGDTLLVNEFDDVGLKLADGGPGFDLQIVDYGGPNLHDYGDALAPGFESAWLRSVPATFMANDLDNQIIVSAGSDYTIFGQGGNDLIDATKGTGRHVLLGELGDDSLIGGDGADSLLGGPGNDVLIGAAGADELTAGDDDDVVQGNDGNDRINGGNGNDNLYGGPGDDAVFGNAGDDLLDGAEGRNALFGGTGNDVFQSWVGSDYLEGQDGLDRLTFPFTILPVSTTLTISRTTATDQVSYRVKGGNTEVNVDARTIEQVTGTPFADTMKLVVPAGFFIDSTRLSGYLDGGDGNDRMYADIQDDFAPNNFNVVGGNGNDTIDASTSNESVILGGGGGSDVVKGGRDSDAINGGAGNDALFGMAGNDVAYGNDGNDYLEGNDGNDRLYGDAGADTLRGGYGVDRFDGGSGDDLFYARDDAKDSLYGGTGTDRAQRNGAEAIIDSVEVTVP